MDFSLRCNSLKCREQLEDRAVVTTCSHIFCVPCSESLGLANPSGDARICPACATNLANPDDAVVTQLNPTEDYKTSVLSGLTPSTIMECAGRGLSFYSYQATQEIVYQEFLARSLTDKYNTMSDRAGRTINDANAEIAALRDRIDAMHDERKGLEKKHNENANKLNERNKQHATLTRMYNSLKQQQLAAGLELAAGHDADNALQTNRQNGYHRNDRPMQSRSGSNGSGNSGGRSKTIHAWENQMGGSRIGLQTAHTAPMPATPSGHRNPLPIYGNNGNASRRAPMVGDAIRQPTPYRAALRGVDPNVYGNGNNGGYGMSAGVKIGRQPEGLISRSGLGVNRNPGYVGHNMHR